MAEVPKNLNLKRTKQENDICLKLIKENIDLFPLFCFEKKNYIDKTFFPNNLKQADITPVHKEDQQKQL